MTDHACLLDKRLVADQIIEALLPGMVHDPKQLRIG
jgi:hypothetical protein